MAEEIKTPETEESGKNFIINFIDEDIAEGGHCLLYTSRCV